MYFNNATFAGALYIQQSHCTLYQVDIHHNSASYGGGMIIISATGEFTNITVSHNFSNFTAAGILIEGDTSANFTFSTISHNRANGQTGGIQILGSAVSSFRNCNITHNWAPHAGGLLISQSSSPTFDHCNIKFNNVSNFGGGGMISATSSPTITNCTFEENIAQGSGGALIILGTATPLLQSSLFQNNIGYHGGAIDINANSQFTIDSCTFKGNVAITKGGAVRFSGLSHPHFHSSSFLSNSALNGAGIAVFDNTSPTLSNCTFANNTALVDGGAIFTADWSNPKFNRCNINGNDAATGTGGGISIFDFSTPSFNESTISENTAPHGAGIYTISSKGISAELNISAPCNCTAILGKFNPDSHPAISKTTIENNHALINGGGISIQGLSYITIIDSIIAQNSAGRYGGGISSSDLSIPAINNTIIRGNSVPQGTGGGISIEGGANPALWNCTITQNNAVRGGGVFVSSRALGTIQASSIQDNNSVFGAGLFIGSFSSFVTSSSFITGNTATLSGGGVALQGSTSSLFSDCIIHNNSASSGGGIYSFPLFNNAPGIALPSLSSPFSITGSHLATLLSWENAVIISLSSNDQCNYSTTDFLDFDVNEVAAIDIQTAKPESIFSNTSVTDNMAYLGGGISLFNSLRQSISFDDSCKVIGNTAEFYGGGLYFASYSTLNKPLFFGSEISNNTGKFAGGGVAWSEIDSSLIGQESDFCENCTIVNNSAGYQTYPEGFATPPVNISFIQNENCPETLPLDESMFMVGVCLLDHFGTLVEGDILESSTFNVTAQATDNCLLSTSSGSLVNSLPSYGNLTFTNLQLQGKNNASCNLEFITAEFVFQSQVIRSYLAPLSCNITLSGCGTDDEVSVGTTYDSCTPKNFWESHRAYIIIFTISALVMLLILLVALQVTLWQRKKRKMRWGKKLQVPDFEGGKPSVSLEDILNDPNIPHIPWEQIEVGRKLGVGAAAVVRQGLWICNGKGSAVALKQLLLPPQQITSDLLKDFLVEIKLTSALYHDNVVRLSGVSCSPELDLYLVTELMERGSIRDVLDTKGANLRWDIRLKLLCDAAKGMAYLHSRNVIHRDLKPRNLLVGRDWTCKVADFGASTIQVHTSKTMTVIGTPSYMAPEVLAHTKYSEKADVYSFGIIIVEVYTGETPYSGPEFADIRNQVQLISRIVKDHLHPDTSKLPPELAHLVYDCWHDEPDLRPSFAEIIIRLRRLRNLDLPSWVEPTSNDNIAEPSVEFEFSASGSEKSFPRSDSPVQLAELTSELSDGADEILSPSTVRKQILSSDSEEQTELEKEALIRSLSVSNIFKRNTRSNSDIKNAKSPLSGSVIPLNKRKTIN